MSNRVILHGVGRLILKDYIDPTKVIACSNLQQFSLESTFSTDDITGGNKMFPIASFKTESALNCTAKDAMFDSGIFPYLDGGETKTGAVTLTDFKEITIPASKEVTLPAETPSNIVVDGFKLGSAKESLKAGEYFVETNKVTFADEDKGKTTTIVYDYESTANANQTSITEKSMSKPFVAIYNFDVYDEDAQIVGKGSITVYKAQCTSGLKLDMSHQAAFAPEFTFSARDPKREDGKLWNFTVDPIANGAAAASAFSAPVTKAKASK